MESFQHALLQLQTNNTQFQATHTEILELKGNNNNNSVFKLK